MTGTTRAGKRSSLGFTIAVVVLIAALAVEAFIYFRPPPEALEAIAQGASLRVETFGDQSATVKIRLYAPLTLAWHEKTIDLLRNYNEEHPGRIHVTLMPKGLADGLQLRRTPHQWGERVHPPGRPGGPAREAAQRVLLHLRQRGRRHHTRRADRGVFLSERVGRRSAVEQGGSRA